MTQFTLWGNYPSKIPSTRVSFHTMQHTGKNTAPLSSWTTDYRSETDAMMITVRVAPQERGVLLCYKCDTVKPPPCGAWQVQGVRVSWILSGGIGQDITPSDPSHCPLPTRKTPAFLFLTRCWQVPLTATWSPGAAVMGNRAPPSTPITDYTVLIPTTHFTPIAHTGNLFPGDVFLTIAAKIKLNMTNKFKRRFIILPIREVGLISLVSVGT